MDLHLTPIQASRKLLAVLASHDTTDFERMLRPNAYLQIKSNGRREVYLSSAEVSQALLREASVWPEPTIHVQSWHEMEDAVTVSFQISGREPHLLAQDEHVLTVMLRDEQIEIITLYCLPATNEIAV